MSKKISLNFEPKVTKIPSVEERVDKVFQEVMADIGKHYKVSDRLSDILSDSLSERLAQTLTADRTALLTELRDSGLLEEKPVNICGFNFKGVTVETEDAVEIIFAYEKIGHNTLARAIKARLDELIKINNV